ncbi:hypothetical protein FRB90_006040 [Tulasnella sp. 427]|nr:hypothetical protein FRB90_006040 [Tulasnella sp. 427]
MTKPRDQLGWYSATEWLLRYTIAVHGFGNDLHSSRNTVTENDVEEVFADYGRILHVQIWQSQKGGVWAFVTFAHKEERDAAIQARDGRPVDLRSRDGRRHIKWDTHLKVVEPRFHSVRFYYDQFAAVNIVPREMEFTPSARPGHGGTYQRTGARMRRPLLRPPTGPRHGRRRSETLLSGTTHHSIYDRSSSPAPSIQWGHEEAATPIPASPAYDSEDTFYSSKEHPVPSNDDDEDVAKGDWGYGPDDIAQSSSSVQNFSQQTPSRDVDSSQHYGDHDDATSAYPQSSRSTCEPSSHSDRPRRSDDEREEEPEDDVYSVNRQLQEENERLRMELEETRRTVDALREQQKANTRSAEEEKVDLRRQNYRLTERLLNGLECGLSKVPDGPDDRLSATPTPFGTNLVQSFQSNQATTLLLSMLSQMASSRSGQP